MSRNDLLSIGEVYGKILNSCKKTIRESNKNAFGSNLNLVGKGPKVDGFHESLNDEKSCCGDGIKASKRQRTTEQMREKLKDSKLTPEQKQRLKKQIDLRTAEEAEEEKLKESKKIGITTLNNLMSKSMFDQLYKKCLMENFGDNFKTNEDTSALGLDDATPDSEFNDDLGEGEDLGEDEGDTVTFTLDRATAQALVDVLQGALGGEEVGDEDLDFEDEGDTEFENEGEDVEEDEMSFEEDEEEGTKELPDKKQGLMSKNNKVSGPPKPKSGKAKSDVTDDTGTTTTTPSINALQGKNNQVPSAVKVGDFFK